MRTVFVLVFAALLSTRPTIATAQETVAPPQPPNQEMSKLDFLVGEWKGEAWVQMGASVKREYILQTEKVQSKLGGKVLLIEGLGCEKREDGTAGKIVHDALAIVSWDPQKKQHRFNSYVVGRPGVDTTIDVGDKTAVWGMTTPQGSRIRYTIRLTDNGEWNEIGEFSRDGEKWSKFFEMNLRREK